jgi:hypothetical protein
MTCGAENDEKAHSTRGEREQPTAKPGGGATVEEMSESSFPASDPPATWTWEVHEIVAGKQGDATTAARTR